MQYRFNGSQSKTKGAVVSARSILHDLCEHSTDSITAQSCMFYIECRLVAILMATLHEDTLARGTSILLCIQKRPYSYMSSALLS